MRNALIVLLGALVVVLVATLVDRRVLAPRREADALVAAARPHASASHEGSWITAESLLARAELLHRGRSDVEELRGKLDENRKSAAARDEQILRVALDACLAAIEKAGFTSDAKSIRDDGAPTRDRHVRCMRVQIQAVSSTAAP